MSTSDRSAGARRRTAIAKRLFDLVIASAALVLLSPILLAIAVLVRVRLGSPIIFRQQRPGLGGRPFTLYKFRTMINEAVDAHGDEIDSVDRTPPWAYKLRSMSLDELPELWNVIKGDMSLVGPRPLLVEYLARYSPHQARRHEVRPGITGLAQVSGRNALGWEERLDLDVRYVDEHDMRMDLDILRRTIDTVISREGVRHAQDVDMPMFMGTDAEDTGKVTDR
jgi:lipopolysaccharide/colanic/teichoic acid biosynthesis glycosyltransferase